METKSDIKIWKIRTIKNYLEAHNHIIVGRVMEITDSYVRLHCKTYHFGTVLNSPKDVIIGSVMERIIPWGRIEIINELPPTFDYVRSSLIADREGEVLFKDKQYLYPFATTGDSV